MTDGKSNPADNKKTRMRGDERRKLMLRNAKRVFARSTFAEASTSELARESEVTEPMLYKHFGNKKGLFLTVLREYGAQSLANFQARMSQRADNDMLEALQHIVEDYRSTINADPETQRILFRAITESHDPEIAQCVSGHNRMVYDMIRQVVECAREKGVLDSKINTDAAAWGYMSMILALQYGLMLNFSTEIAINQKETYDIWFRGLTTTDS
jgi:AcrR family transcriptional regulator